MIQIFIGAGLVLGLLFLLVFFFRRTVKQSPGQLVEPPKPDSGQDLSGAVTAAHPDILFLLDGAGLILDCRGPALNALDQAPEWFVGRRLSELFSPDLAEVLEKMEALQRSSELLLTERVWPLWNVNKAFEIRLSRVDGHRFLALVRNVSSFHGTWSDDLQRNKVESLAVLAGGLAHDLNNGLAVIQGFVSLVRGQLAQPERVLANLEKASLATKRAAGLTVQLQKLAHGGDFHRSLLSIRELAEEAALFALVGSSCLLSLEAGSGPWIVEANPQQLSQVFRNLVLNAVQAMPQGGTVTLAFRRQPGDRIAISVVDEGPGIATGVQPRIFEPYFSTRPQGTGLGLSVAREVIQRHGGTIEFESREGQGCCFTVFLPGARKASDVAEPPTQGPVLQGHRVLVMEDEADLRDLMVEVSVSLGMEATACRNGREAVTVFDTFRAEGRPFSLVVSDLLVPGDMGGREMIAQLRSRSGEFRALAVTGFSTHRFVEDFQHQGFDVIVGKPFTVDEFKTRIVELMKDPWKNVSNI